MILSNVNIGSGPNAGNGDKLRTAFNTINNNFARIQSNVNAITNSVSSVAGRTGNVIITTQDVVGINNYATITYVNSQIANAGAANISSLQSNVAALQADVNTLYGNAGVQSSTLATLTSNAALQAGNLATLTSNAAVQAGELATLLANAAVQAGQISSLNANLIPYGNSNVATYLTSYGGNVSVGNIIFDDLSVQTTAYTGTQWRSNLESNVRVKPSWLTYVAGGKNQEGTQYGFDSSGMFFTSNADGDFAYPIQTSLHFHEQDVLEVAATIYFGATNNDHGLCIFPADTRPIWQAGSNTSRIAFQYSSGIPVLYGQTTANTAPGSPVLSAGNYYTIKFKYDPGNTVVVETFSGNTASGSPIDTRSLGEILPPGDYKLGFDADNDAAGVKSYWTNLIVRTLTNTVVNDLEVQGQIIGNLIPQSNVTQSLGNVTHQWKELWVSGNTIHLGGAQLSVSGGVINTSLPIAGNVQTSNLIITGANISFSNGAYIEETEIVGNPGYYGLALNSSDDGVVGLNALDSNSEISSSVIVSNVQIQLNVANSTPGGNALVWLFDQSGSITFPDGTSQSTAGVAGNITVGNSAVNFVANSSGDGAGYSTIELRPDVNAYSDAYLIIDPTAPSHIHIRAGGTQDNSNSDLFLGGENSHVRIPAGANTAPYIKSNGYEWQFGTDGILTLAPGGAIYAPFNDPIDIRVRDSGNVGYAIEQSVRDGTGTLQTLTSLDRQEFKIYTDFQDTNNVWTFAKSGQFSLAGNLRFPDSTVQTTAWTGTVAYGNTIAIGYSAGLSSQGNEAVAIGRLAGNVNQGGVSVAIGRAAGRDNQGIEAVSLGVDAGQQNQGDYGIAIGSVTAYLNQGLGAVAIGTSAGSVNQGTHAIAIGTGAGNGNQGNSSIILNATGSPLDQSTDNTFTVKPIRSASAGNILYYDPSSGEITYSTNSGGGSYGNANVAVFLGSFGSNTITTTGNISAGNVNANNSVHFGTGRARITTDDNTSILLTPDTAANALAGVKIGGNGYLLAPNGARNITLNYGSVNGAVGLQANVTVGSAGSGNLTVNGTTTTGNLSTAGNILSSGVNGKIGYSAGGYVVQSGNTSGVTLNTVSGNIQLDTVNIAVNTSHTVALTNNKLDASDIILVQGQDSSALDLHIGAYYLTTNTAIIYLRNISGSSIGPIAPMLKFIIVKAPGS